MLQWVEALTREARRVQAPGSGELEFCLAECIMEACQRLPFRPAPRRRDLDLVQSPEVTLAVGGDCDELSVLAVAADSLSGLESRLCWLSQPDALEDHVLPEVLVAGRWYYQETTVPGARLGELPGDARARIERDRGLVDFLSRRDCQCHDGA